MNLCPDIPKERPPRRIVIVDDHPIYREGLAAVFQRTPEYSVCGEADNAEDALDLVVRERPDLVLVDLGLPHRSGLDLIRDIYEIDSQLPVLAVSMHDELLYAERVLSAGGRGYIMKQAGPDALLKAVASVFSGQIAVSEHVSDWLLQSARFGRHRPADNSSVKLTEREFAIMQFISHGKTCREIANELRLSVKTVNTHRGQIRKKLNLKSSAQLIQYAVKSLGVLGG